MEFSIHTTTDIPAGSRMEAGKHGLLLKVPFHGTEVNAMHLCGLPYHVALATANAFNAAMEAERKPVAAE